MSNFVLGGGGDEGGFANAIYRPPELDLSRRHAYWACISREAEKPWHERSRCVEGLPDKDCCQQTSGGYVQTLRSARPLCSTCRTTFALSAYALIAHQSLHLRTAAVGTRPAPVRWLDPCDILVIPSLTPTASFTSSPHCTSAAQVLHPHAVMPHPSSSWAQGNH